MFVAFVDGLHWRHIHILVPSTAIKRGPSRRVGDSPTRKPGRFFSNVVQVNWNHVFGISRKHRFNTFDAILELKYWMPSSPKHIHELFAAQFCCFLGGNPSQPRYMAVGHSGRRFPKLISETQLKPPRPTSSSCNSDQPTECTGATCREGTFWRTWWENESCEKKHGVFLTVKKILSSWYFAHLWIYLIKCLLKLWFDHPHLSQLQRIKDVMWCDFDCLDDPTSPVVTKLELFEIPLYWCDSESYYPTSQVFTVGKSGRMTSK